MSSAVEWVISCYWIRYNVGNFGDTSA